MIAETLPGLSKLSLEQKWLLANELIDEVDEQQAKIPTQPAIIELVLRRFADHERDPSTAMTLEAFKLRHSLP